MDIISELEFIIGDVSSANPHIFGKSSIEASFFIARGFYNLS